MKTKITIDPELRANIPPLLREEREQLEANLRADGCREALCVWEHGGLSYLLDGHNRYEICTRLDIPFETRRIELPDREAALDWMDRNQLGRRNISEQARSLIIGRMLERTRRRVGRPAKLRQSAAVSGAPAQSISKEHGVHRRTVERNAGFARAVEVLKLIIPDIEQRVMAREGAPTKKAIMEAAKVAPHDPDEAALIIQGQPREKPNREPIKQVNGVVRRRGRALDLAHEAIAVLKKIPRRDPFREDSMKIVIGYCKGVLNGVS